MSFLHFPLEVILTRTRTQGKINHNIIYPEICVRFQLKGHENLLGEDKTSWSEAFSVPKSFLFSLHRQGGETKISFFINY